MDVDDASKYELKETKAGTEKTAPQKRQQASPAIQPAVDRTSRLRDALRQFKLQILSHIPKWRAPIEHRKVAIYESRCMAAFHSLLHVVPLGGAVTLLCLHWTDHFIGGTTYPHTTTLQFVAKAHELLMQMSLVNVVLCIVRTQVLHGYMPLGALSVSVHATHLSYLWSLEFLSVFKSTVFKAWWDAALFSLVPLIVFLTAIVGPSSAVMMIPRPGCSSVNATALRFLNESFTDLFPSHVDSSLGMRLDLTNFNYSLPYYGGISDPQDSLSRSSINTDGRWYQRLLRYSELPSKYLEPVNGSKSTFYNLDSYSSTAIMPTRFSAEELWEVSGTPPLPWLSNGTLSVSLPQPVVSVRCTVINQEIIPDLPIFYIRDANVLDTRVSGDLLANISHIFDEVSSLGEPDKEGNTGSYYYPPLWKRSPEAGSRSLIGVFVSKHINMSTSSNLTTIPLPRLLEDENIKNPSLNLQVWTCTVSAVWSTISTELVYSDAPPLIRTVMFKPSSVSRSPDTRPLSMNISGIPSFHAATFHNMVYNLGNEYEPVLAAAFTTALSEVSGDQHRSWVEWSTPSTWDGKRTTPIEYISREYGYGYGTTLTSVRLSVVVISAYCVVVIAYVAYTLITGSTSTAWNSAIELVALALQSQKPDHLGDVSVGIDSMKTFRESVGIRVNRQDELELVFAHDRDIDSRGLRKIERNKAY